MCIVLWVGPFRVAAQPATGSGSEVAASRRTEQVTIGTELFELEIAATPRAIEKGLMHRADISPNGGMLFIFPREGPRAFWMAYTLVDLDIIFLDNDGVVTAATAMKAEEPRAEGEAEAAYHARLPRYPSAGPARYAIEFKAGTLGLLGLKVGDKVRLDHARVRALVEE